MHDWCYGLDFDENYNISHGHYKLNLCDALCGDPMAIPDKSVFEYLPWSDVKRGVFVSHFEEQRWHRKNGAKTVVHVSTPGIKGSEITI